MTPVTDPAILAKLNGAAPVPVTDPAILAKLNGQPVDNGFQVGEIISNIPGSAKDYAGSIIQPFLHPVDTVNNFREMGLKGTKDAFINLYKERYGSPKKALQTLESDPVGAMADLSFILTGPSGLAARAPGIAGKAGAAVNTVAKAVEPLNLVKGGVRTATKAIVPEGLPTRLYESASKFSTTFTPEQRLAMSGTALKHGVLPTAKGIDRVNKVMTGLDNRITDLIDKATKSGASVPKKAIYKYLRESRKKMGGATVDAAKDLKQIDKVAKAFDEHLKNLGKDRLTPTELQAFKRDAYKRINFERSQGTAKLGAEEARKGMARAAKELVEESAPEVKDLNQQLGELLQLKEPLSKASGRIANRDITGIMAPLNIGAGGVAGGAPGAAVGTIMALLEKPSIKARIARRLYNAQHREISDLFDFGITPTLTQQGLFQAGRQPLSDQNEIAK